MDYNKVVGRRIFTARKELGLTRKELGKKLSLHESTIKRYEDGDIKTLDIEKMIEFAKALNVPPDYIMAWDKEVDNMMGINAKRYEVAIVAQALSENKPLSELIEELKSKGAPKDVLERIDYLYLNQASILSRNLRSAISTPDFKLTPPTEYTTIPVFGAIACGDPIEAVNDVIDYATIPASWLNGGQEYFCLTAAGDSMAPLIQEGDLAVIRKQPTFENGQICAVFINGYDATLKKVYKNGNIITLQPINPDKEIKSYELGGDIEIQIIGVMVELRKRFM
ncbi:helix-turn-helix domain-containing protein [Peptococcus simiae]|uniref:Helix-turn-helix domain-containing protein n=1 Tax=Peptococcus simiae TaxID=1643805 RepID=A0ABW9H0U7_9FIRM